jgi:hypothetical protein
MAKNRSLNKIGKEFDELVADMKKTAADWAKASGAKKQTLLMKMKQMTKEKKELQAEMERAVMDVDKDATLQVDERYVKIAMKSAIGRLVEEQLKTIIPNRTARRSLKRLTESANLLESRSQSISRSLRKGMSESTWNNVQNTCRSVLGITEAGMSDDALAKVIAQVAKEASGGKVAVDPNKINIDALENPESIDSREDFIEENLLTEGDPVTTALLAAPTIIKFLGGIIDWVGGLAMGNEESRAVNRIIGRMHAYAKKNNQIPAKQDMVKELGGVGKGIMSGVSFKDDAKYIDQAYERVAEFVEKANAAGAGKPGHHNSEFSAEGAGSQPVDEHMLHMLHDASANTKVGKFLGNLAHKLHEIYLVPLQVVITGVIFLVMPSKIMQAKKVWAQAKKIAEFIYAFVMLFVAVKGGIGAFQHIAELMPQLQSALDATGHAGTIFTAVADSAKAGDMSVEVLKGILSLAGK